MTWPRKVRVLEAIGRAIGWLLVLAVMGLVVGLVAGAWLWAKQILTGG